MNIVINKTHYSLRVCETLFSLYNICIEIKRLDIAGHFKLACFGGDGIEISINT